MKICYDCKQNKENSEFNKNKSTKDGLAWECRNCSKIRWISYYKRNYEKTNQKSRTRYNEIKDFIHKKRKKYYLDYYHNNPDRKIKQRVRNILYKAIKKGLIRKRPCENCGTKDNIQGHHYKGYEKENALLVQWLCSHCHKQLDKKLEYK